jgi:hypothetical protein
MDGPQRATDPAVDTLLGLSTISLRTRFLMDRGLVARRPDPEGGRGMPPTASTAGFASLEQYRRERDSEVAAVLERRPLRDRVRLVRPLTISITTCWHITTRDTAQ